MTTSIIRVTSSNPDSGSISAREIIPFTVDSADIAYISASASVKLSNTNTFQVITQTVTDEPIMFGSTYYTPIYKEKISYEQWLTTVNKNFRELT